MHREVPPGLVSTVHPDGDDLVIYLHEPEPPLPPLATAMAATAYLGTAVGAVFAGPSFFLMHAAGSIATLALAQHLKDRAIPRVVVSREGWSRHGEAPARARWIQLAGDPFVDGEATLWIDGHRLRTFPTGVDHPYSYADLTWLGHTLAETLRAPFRDHRDPIAWRAWEDSPAVRIRTVLEQRHAQSALQLPRSFDVPAYHPRDLALDHDGLTFSVPSARRKGRTMRIGRDHVSIDDRRHPLPAVLGVAVAVERQGRTWHGRLQIGLYDTIYEIGTAHTPEELRMLRGIAILLEDAKAQARADRGSIHDVPSQLLEVRERARPR